MLLWCFCSLSRSVGRATLMNLWMGASRRLRVSLVPSSAMCPADGPQLTPRRRNLDAAPACFFFSFFYNSQPPRTLQIPVECNLIKTQIKWPNSVTHTSLPTRLKLAPESNIFHTVGCQNDLKKKKIYSLQNTVLQKHLPSSDSNM